MEAAPEKVAPRDDPATVAAGLRQSLESTHHGFTRFVDSLRASGMASAAPAYRQLRAVLIQQRLWAEHQGRTELLPLFKAIAETAAVARSILGPYIEVMADLEGLDRIGAPRVEPAAPPEVEPAPAPAPSQPEDAMSGVVAVLLTHGPCSLGRLARLTGMPESDLQSELRRLVESGSLEQTGWGRGAGYRVSVSWVQSLLRRST